MQFPFGNPEEPVEYFFLVLFTDTNTIILYRNTAIFSFGKSGDKDIGLDSIFNGIFNKVNKCQQHIIFISRDDCGCLRKRSLNNCILLFSQWMKVGNSLVQ